MSSDPLSFPSLFEADDPFAAMFATFDPNNAMGDSNIAINTTQRDPSPTITAPAPAPAKARKRARNDSSSSASSDSSSDSSDSPGPKKKNNSKKQSTSAANASASGAHMVDSLFSSDPALASSHSLFDGPPSGAAAAPAAKAKKPRPSRAKKSLALKDKDNAGAATGGRSKPKKKDDTASSPAVHASGASPATPASAVAAGGPGSKNNNTASKHKKSLAFDPSVTGGEAPAPAPVPAALAHIPGGAASCIGVGPSGLFGSSVGDLMFAFGDQRQVYPPTVALMETIIANSITQLTMSSMYIFPGKREKFKLENVLFRLQGCGNMPLLARELHSKGQEFTAKRRDEHEKVAGIKKSIKEKMAAQAQGQGGQGQGQGQGAANNQNNNNTSSK